MSTSVINRSVSLSLSLSGGFAVKPKSVVKFTASSTEISGVRPVAGRKPANASTTEQRERRQRRRGQNGETKTVSEELNFTWWMFYTFLYLKPVFQGFLHLLEVSFLFLNVYFCSCTCVLCVTAFWWTDWSSYDFEAAELSFCVRPTLLRWCEQNQPLCQDQSGPHRLQVITVAAAW